jgi:hypothetical protein
MATEHLPRSQRHLWGIGRIFMLATAMVALLAGCGSTSTGASSKPPTATTTSTATATPGNVYTDPLLGYRLTLPSGWRATAYRGQHPAGHDVAVMSEPTPSDSTITLGVFHGPNMPAAFAAHGAPSLHIGAYPAFAADTSLSQGKVPCLVRILLAGNDYVLAEWCAMDASSHTSAFEQLLASYVAAPAHFSPSVTTSAPALPTCANIMAAYGYGSTSWGHTLAQPSATAPNRGWASLAGMYLCSNSGSPDHYLFQCTELINRYDAQQWGMAHIPGSAARYFDYYQNGALHPGDVRDFPAGSYALSDDASQGTSAFAPQPGDLLIFQDVANPAQGWKSGLIASPGHIALITAVDATHLYVAQENYNDRQYFLALAMRHTIQGYAISDRSGVAGRIVRGWIRFTAA